MPGSLNKEVWPLCLKKERGVASMPGRLNERGMASMSSSFIK